MAVASGRIVVWRGTVGGRRQWSDLDADDRQDLTQPHRGREAAGADGEDQRYPRFGALDEIAATGSAAIVPEGVPPAADSGDHGVLRADGKEGMVAHVGYR